jgi:2-polyprenyl-3-methyl-5-hydroxy-6-metoxy-1,4-benzoquinol methylase
MNSSGTFFNDFAEKFDTLYDGKRGWVMQWLDRHFRSDMFVRFEITFNFLGDLSDKRVLDVGCGSGPYIVEALRRRALHVTGIDAAPRMLALAHQRIARIGMQEKVTLAGGYFPETCPPGKFEFGIVMGVMDYVEDAATILQSLQSVVTQRAAVSFPSVHWFRSPLRRVRYKVRRCPLFLYTPAQIERLMKETGVVDYHLTKIPGAGMDYVACLSH